MSVEQEKVLICGRCKKQLDEDYPVVYDGKLIHEKCYNKLRKK